MHLYIVNRGRNHYSLGRFGEICKGWIPGNLCKRMFALSYMHIYLARKGCRFPKLPCDLYDLNPIEAAFNLNSGTTLSDSKRNVYYFFKYLIIIPPILFTTELTYFANGIHVLQQIACLLHIYQY